MKIARGLLLSVVAACMAMAVAASSASAADGVELTIEPGSSHCVPVICPLHGLGEITLAGHVFGIEATAADCNLEFRGSVAESGEGSFTLATLTSHPGQNDCTRVACYVTPGDIKPWPIHFEEEGGLRLIHIEICTVPSGGGAESRCLIEVPVSYPTAHHYEMLISDVRGVAHAGTACEVTGQIHLEEEPDFPGIEVVHTP